jgi:Fe-S-cluster containining protein
MHLCDICPKPGRCCSNFLLFGIGNVDDLFHKDTWQEESTRATSDVGVPYFKPVLAVPHAMPYDDGMVRVEFSCTNLLNGRCSIYDSRPSVCRKYVPSQDILCVFGKEIRVNPSEGEEKWLSS